MQAELNKEVAENGPVEIEVQTDEKKTKEKTTAKNSNHHSLLLQVSKIWNCTWLLSSFSFCSLFFFEVGEKRGGEGHQFTFMGRDQSMHVLEVWTHVVQLLGVSQRDDSGYACYWLCCFSFFFFSSFLQVRLAVNQLIYVILNYKHVILNQVL